MLGAYCYAYDDTLLEQIGNLPKPERVWDWHERYWEVRYERLVKVQAWIEAAAAANDFGL